MADKRQLKVETESLIVAAQDQALATRYRRFIIHKIPGTTKCRMCGLYDETVDHVVSGCPELAKLEYLTRHDKVCAQVHFEICKKLNVPIEAKKWYDHQPKTVTQTSDGKIRILWNMEVRTDREVKANRMDITSGSERDLVF